MSLATDLAALQTGATSLKRAGDPDVTVLRLNGAVSAGATSINVHSNVGVETIPLGARIVIDSETLFVNGAAGVASSINIPVTTLVSNHADNSNVSIYFDRVAGLEFILRAPDGSWPTLMCKGGAAKQGSQIVDATNTLPITGTNADFHTIAASVLGTISVPGHSVPSITEPSSGWEHITLHYGSEFDVTLSRLTPAMLIETSQSSIRLFGGNAPTKRTTNNASPNATITETDNQEILPKFVAWHESDGYHVDLISNSPSLASIDQPWLLVWFGSNSHWLDTTLPVSYSHDAGQGGAGMPARYAIQADCPILLSFGTNPTSVGHTSGQGGVDIAWSGAQAISALPLYGRLRQVAGTTNTWSNGSALAAGAKTLIAAWYLRLGMFPYTASKSFAYDAPTDTATITEQVTLWKTVNGSGTKFCPIPPTVGITSQIAVAGVNKIAFDGDSLTAGQGATSGYGSANTTGTNYPGRVMNALGTTYYTGANFGHAGDEIADMISGAQAVDKFYDATATRNISLILGGYNDLASSISPSTIYASLVSYWKARKRLGYKVIAFTVFSGSGGGLGSFETNRQSLNTLIRAGWMNYCDGLADVGANAIIGAPGTYTNLTYFQSDGIHLTDAGYQIVANIALDQIHKVVSIGSPTFTVDVSGTGGTDVPGTVLCVPGTIVPGSSPTAGGGTITATVVDGSVSTELGPILGITDVDSYHWSVSNLAPYTAPRLAPDNGVVPTDIMTLINSQVDKIIAHAHWRPWYYHARTPQDGISGDVSFANPADTLALVSEFIPVVSGTRKTNLISWLQTEKTAYNPETVYHLDGSETGTERGPDSIPSSQGDAWFAAKNTTVFQSRQWLWACWGLARFYQETGTSLSGLTLATNLLPILELDMAEQDWATGHWFASHGDRQTSIENANRHWAGLAGLSWLMQQKSDANEGIVRALLAVATTTRIAMTHMPRWQASVGLITLPTDLVSLGVATSNAHWLPRVGPAWQGFVYTYAWATSLDDPRQVIRLNQFQCFLDDSNARDGWNVGQDYAYQPPYRSWVKPLADMLQGAVPGEVDIYAKKVHELHPNWWQPSADHFLGQEQGRLHPADSHGMLLNNAWITKLDIVTLKRQVAYPWLADADLFTLHKAIEVARTAALQRISGVAANATDLVMGQKFELSFMVQTSAERPDLPYDGTATIAGLDTTKGCTVDVALTHQPTGTVVNYPAFHCDPWTITQISGSDFLYPDESAQPPIGWVPFVLRITLEQVGDWTTEISVTDAAGTATMTGATVVIADDPAYKGFIEVSPSDGRYFRRTKSLEYEPSIGTHMDSGPTSINPVTGNSFITDHGAAGIDFMRTWLSGFGAFGGYSSPWRNMTDGGNAEVGHFVVPNDGIAYADHDLAHEIWEGATSGSGKPATVYGWIYAPLNMKPLTNYQLFIRYKILTTLVADTGGQSHGFTVKVADATWISNPWLYSSLGIRLFSPITTAAGWQELTAPWTTTSYRTPILVPVIENCAFGNVYFDEISVREDYGNGTFGPELISKPSMAMHYYVSQQQAYRWDKVLELAEAANVNLKIVLMDHNDEVLQSIDLDTGLGEVADTANFYGYVDGSMSKGRWLERAWWRYVQARWGYSTSVHSWELNNEGDPFNGRHYKLADDFEVMMAGWDVNTHPASTSTWGDNLVESNFWLNVLYPNPSFVDFHHYIYDIDTPVTINHPSGPSSYTSLAAEHGDTASWYLNLAAVVGPNQPGGVPGKPIFVGETALVSTDSGVPSDLSADTAGIWLHKFIWAHTAPYGVHTTWWHSSQLVYPSTSPTLNLRPIMTKWLSWIRQFPLANGHYVDIAATVPSGLRAVGQKDLTNNTAHVWVDNTGHTTANVVASISPTPVSGPISFTMTNGSYTVTPYNTYTGVNGTLFNITVASGTATWSLPSTSTDIAYKIAPAGITPPSPTITSFAASSGIVGDSVVITGTDFTGASDVSFNGHSASVYTVDSPTQITVTVPSGATTGTISVTTAGGTGTSSGSFTVTTGGGGSSSGFTGILGTALSYPSNIVPGIVPVIAPAITSFTPTSGAIGTVVIITGTGLTGASVVTFNGVSASIYTVDNDTQITATVPSSTITGTISITTPGGTATSSGSFTVTSSGFTAVLGTAASYPTNIVPGFGTTSGAGSLTSVAPVVGTVVETNVTQRVNFIGSSTSWLSSTPVVVPSAGSLGTIIPDSDGTAHAAFTAPATAQVVTFTNTTNGNSTATLTVVQNAVSFTISGPSSGRSGVASATFTVALPANRAVAAPITVTPLDGGAGGTFTPSSVTLDANTVAASATFTYTPSYGTATRIISVINNGGLSNPLSITYDVTSGSLVSVAPNSGTVFVVGGAAQRVNFAGLNTIWLTNPLTISFSAGSLGPITIDSDNTAHATYTLPLTAQTVTATDTSDGGSTTATLSVLAAATTYTVSGPSRGKPSTQSAAFTVALPSNTGINASVTITPSSSTGTFTPSTVTLIANTNGASATFTYTPNSVETIRTIAFANSASLTNQTSLAYLVTLAVLNNSSGLGLGLGLHL